jgi:hypothetical protein
MRPVLRERMAEPIERFGMLDPVARPLKALVDRLVPAGGASRDLLGGTWLGHPLHPVLTDVVVGTWMSSFLLDLVPGKQTRAASDRLIAMGILAAVPTAAAGLSDWAEMGEGARRVGRGPRHGEHRRAGAVHRLLGVQEAGQAAAGLVALGRGLWGGILLRLPRRAPQFLPT